MRGHPPPLLLSAFPATVSPSPVIPHEPSLPFPACSLQCLTPLLCSLQKDELYLNLVLEYVPETVYRVARHFTKAKLTIPIIYVKVGRQAGQLAFGTGAYRARGPGSSCLLWLPFSSKLMLLSGALEFPILVSITVIELAQGGAGPPRA